MALKFYGPATRSQEWGGETEHKGAFKQLEYVFDYDDLPAADDGNEMVLQIPANSWVKEVYLQTLATVTGSDGSTTNPYLLVGLAQEDGTAIDADGLVAVAALTDINAVGEVVTGSGTSAALVANGTGIGANAAVVTVAVDGSSTITAGKMRLVIEYLEV